MAARVLKSFLIGLGYDTKGLEEGESKFKSSIGGVKSNALTMSAALVGAFALAATSVAATANEVDQLNLRTQNMRTSTNTVYDFGNALKLAGGEASEAVDALARFEEIQNNLRLKGDAGPITDLAQAGIDVSTLYGTQTGEEFARALAGMLPNLDEGQRAVAQEALGLSDATFRALAGGVDALDASLEKARGLTGNIEQLSEDSRKLRESSATLGLAVEGARNELANNFLPAMVGATGAAAGFAMTVSDFIAARNDTGKAFEQSGATGVLAVQAEKAGAEAGGAALRVAGTALEKSEEIGLAEMIIPGYKQAQELYDFLFNQPAPVTSVEAGSGRIIRDLPGDPLTMNSRSASDSMPPADSSREDERKASAEALAGALSRSPIKVENTTNMTVQLDGAALEAKIIDVTESQAYQALEDFQSTTER